MSQGQDKLTWRILHASVIGASHAGSRLPNQDAILYKQNSEVGVPLVLSIADGHGSEKYFRSHIGSQFAVQAAEEVLHAFVRGLKERGRGSYPPFSEIETMTQRVPLEIVARWRRLVADHWQSNPANDQEWRWMIKKENADAWKAITSNHALPYGATLLTVLVTDAFILYFQLGDGDILTVSATGEVQEPVPADQRNLANETTSLCNPIAEQDFRMVFQRLAHPKPALILLSTDGYSNSFVQKAGFHKVGSDIWHMIRSQGVQGIQQVEKNLEGWLSRATQVGSGDDITVGILCRISALSEPIVIPTAAPSQESKTPTAVSAAPSEGNNRNSAEQGTVIRSDTRPTTSPLAALHEQDQTGSQEAKERALSGGPLVPPVARRILTVSPTAQGEDCYTSITAALQVAPPHARIHVKPGLYRERLLIEKPVEIIGVGPHQEIIIEHSAPCLHIKTEQALIEGLTIQGTCESEDNKREAALELFQGQIAVHHCNVTSQTQFCVAIVGENTHAVMEQCQIHGGSGYGILFDKQSKGHVEDCRVERNVGGIAIWRNSGCTIRNCTISSNTKWGIVLSNNSRGEFVECIIAQKNRQGTGVSVREGSEALLQHCKVFGGATGILVEGLGGSRIIDYTQIYDNGTGIKIRNKDTKNGDDACFVFLKESTIYENNAMGIEVDDNQLAAQDCQVQDKELHMIKALPDGHIVLKKYHSHDKRLESASSTGLAHGEQVESKDVQ